MRGAAGCWAKSRRVCIEGGGGGGGGGGCRGGGGVGGGGIGKEGVESGKMGAFRRIFIEDGRKSNADLFVYMCTRVMVERQAKITVKKKKQRCVVERCWFSTKHVALR